MNIWSELQFLIPIGVTCDVKNGDCRIPLLESVFEAFPNIPINVDIKTNSDVLIDKVSGLITIVYCHVVFKVSVLIQFQF